MLPQPVFLNELMNFLSNENLDTKNIKKGIDKIFSKKDLRFLIELNIKIMGIAKLILKSNDELNVLLSQIDSNRKIKYSFEKLEIKKEIDINLNDLKDCNNTKLVEIIKNEYRDNIIKELDIHSSTEKIKILFIINDVPKSLKSFYKEYEFRDYGLVNHLEFDKIWNHYEENVRYFTILTSIGANKIKFRLEKIQNENEDKKDELNVLEIGLDKEE